MTYKAYIIRVEGDGGNVKYVALTNTGNYFLVNNPAYAREYKTKKGATISLGRFLKRTSIRREYGTYRMAYVLPRLFTPNESSQFLKKIRRGRRW